MENEIVIHNGTLLTMEQGLPVIENAMVRIKGDKIAECGPALPGQNLAGATRIDARGLNI